MKERYNCELLYYERRDVTLCETIYIKRLQRYCNLKLICICYNKIIVINLTLKRVDRKEQKCRSVQNKPFKFGLNGQPVIKVDCTSKLFV